MELFQDIQAWHWLVLGLVLLGAEALGASGFLLGAGAAAIVQAIIGVVFPEISGQLQFISFAIFAIAFTVIYWRFFKNFNEETDHENINDRATQLIGRKVTLTKALPTGEGKIQIGDTLWKVHTNSVLLKGDLVEVTAANDMTLEIQKVG